MITNSELTLFHKTFDKISKTNVWVRHNYTNVWWFGGKGSSVNKGYENANDVDVRIPYNTNTNAQISDFAIRRYNLSRKIRKRHYKRNSSSK